MLAAEPFGSVSDTVGAAGGVLAVGFPGLLLVVAVSDGNPSLKVNVTCAPAIGAPAGEAVRVALMFTGVPGETVRRPDVGSESWTGWKTATGMEKAR